MKRSFSIVLSVSLGLGFIALGIPDAAEKFPVKPMEFTSPLRPDRTGM